MIGDQDVGDPDRHGDRLLSLVKTTMLVAFGLLVLADLWWGAQAVRDEPLAERGHAFSVDSTRPLPSAKP